MIGTLIRGLAAIPQQLNYRRSLAGRPLVVPQGAPVLSYGSVRDIGGLIAGGRVKLTHLADRWPESDSTARG